MTSNEVIAEGLREHQKGELGRAEALYRQVLGNNPKHPNALNFLGMILAETGRAEEGVELMRQAAEIVPTFAPFHANLGETYRRLKRLEPAVSSLRRAIELNPQLAEAHNNMSAALADLRRWDEAIGAAERAVAIRPGFAGAYFNLGNALGGAGRLEQAVAAYRRALEIQPGYFDALMNLGAVYKNLFKFNEAIGAFSEAVRMKPNSADAYNNLAVTLDHLGNAEAALKMYAAAVKLNPNHMRAQSNYGYLLAKAGRLAEALEACTAAIAQKDADGGAFAYMGVVQNELGNPDAAVEYCSRAISLEPNLAVAHDALAAAMKDRGEIQAAVEGFRRAAELDPSNSGFRSNLVYTLYFGADSTPEELLREHRLWGEKFCRPLRPFIQQFGNDRDPDRRLKIGYVSPDLRSHPVGRFMRPLLANHDHGNFEIFCYSSASNPDSLTARLRERADVWRDVRTLANWELAERIRADGIDVLVDLTMHMQGNRMTVFSRKAAPVQATYLAYAGTSGLDTMDYRITDPWLDPPGGSDENYTERSVRVTSYWCYEPPMENLGRTPPPSIDAGFVRFGCLNNFCKINAGVLATWSRILGAVAGSRLVVHAKHGSHRERLLESMAKLGIDPGRVEFVEMRSLPAYLAEYGRIDIGLDPFPYVGGTTTCDALWMGVPVVTLRGTTAIARGGVSIMNNIGLPGLVGESTDEYVRIAVELAKDKEKLMRLRESLRDRMAGSALMDAKRFARDMEGAYRWMWREYLGRGEGG